MDKSNRLRVGIFFNARRSQGGLYQYALTLVDALSRFAPEFEYRLYHATFEEIPIGALPGNWKLIHLPRVSVLVHRLMEAALLSLAQIGVNIPFRILPQFARIKHEKVDAIIYVKPGVHPFQWKYRAIFPIHDLQHRLQTEFQEVASPSEYRRREYFYPRSIQSASAILTDSETGSEDVVNCYGTEKQKLFAVPYVAPAVMESQISAESLERVRNKYALPSQYLFYPAVFWKHKNHLRLVKAVSLIAAERNVRIPLVLAGSKRLEYPVVSGLVESLGLQDIVHFLGYVPDEDMAALYRQALALTMPTFFGPTNIPILEAWLTRCAVITSDLRGIREQVGDAGLLVNPRDERSIADAVWTLYTSPQMRQDLIDRGEVRVKRWTPQNFAQQVSAAIRYAVTV